MITDECIDSVNDAAGSTNFDAELRKACGSPEAIVDGKRSHKRQFPLVVEERTSQKKQISLLQPGDQQMMTTPDSSIPLPSTGRENTELDCKKTPEKLGNPPPPYNQRDFLFAPNQRRYLSRLSHMSTPASNRDYFCLGLRRKLNFKDF